MEDKGFIRSLLNENAEAIADFSIHQTPSVFEACWKGKWSTGQVISHLIKSIEPVNLALVFPKFMLRILFGKPNRDSRTYQQLVQRYLNKLNAGGRASRPFIPPNITANQKDTLIKKFQKECSKLNSMMSLWSEEQLDNYLLPHPLLGKLTVREMLFFSAYHIRHHLDLLQSRSNK